MTKPVQSDLELLQGCLKGQSSAQYALYQRFGPLTFGICRRYAADIMEAEDMHQLGWIRAFDKLDLYKNDGPLGAWLRRLFVHTCLNAWKKKKSRLQWFPLGPEDESLDVPDLVVQGDFLEMEELVKSMAELPEGPRLVVNLYAVEGMNHKEIAQELGISEETSRQQLRQARIRLGRMLGKNKPQSTVSKEAR